MELFTKYAFSINTATFLIAVSGWMFCYYNFSANRYGWQQGMWSVNGYYVWIGFISLIVLFFLLPENYDFKDIAILYILSFFLSGLVLQMGKEWSQINAFLFSIIGYTLYFTIHY